MRGISSTDGCSAFQIPALGEGLPWPATEVSLTICVIPASWMASMASGLARPETAGVTALTDAYGMSPSDLM